MIFYVEGFLKCKNSLKYSNNQAKIEHIQIRNNLQAILSKIQAKCTFDDTNYELWDCHKFVISFEHYSFNCKLTKNQL
jgi:hypothetical protein